MVTYPWRLSDFWNSKVRVIVSARERFWSERTSRRPFLKKRRLRMRRVFGRRFSSSIFVQRYLQDLIAKKKAPVKS